MRFKLCLAALAATVAFATPAAAQTVVADGDPQARGVVLQPLTLTKLTDLNFGTVLAEGATGVGGTVTINADTGNRTFGGAGGVTPVSTDGGHRGLFQGTGDAGEQVILTLTAPTTLAGPGTATIGVGGMWLDSAGVSGDPRTIPVGDTFLVGVGGTFNIAAGQANGTYTADFTLTAQYP